MGRYLAGTVLSFVLSVTCGCASAGPVQAEPNQASAVKAEESPQVSRFEALRRFGQVLDLVERSYVKDVTQDDLINGALKGMLQGLDPHSAFLSPDEYKEMQESTKGEFFGVGIEISQENGQVIVVTPIEDTPAYKAGLQAGDVILAINGQPTQELSLSDVVSRIRGPKGTEVELTILHSDSKKPVVTRIVRDAIPLLSVKSRRLGDGYYWIRLTRFSEKTGDDLGAALAEAEKECKSLGGVRGIVLDLRNNPGGLLDQAVKVSDYFLTSGPIVSIRGRSGEGRVFSATKSASDVHMPVVVLVNSGSASASEIVSGALKDQHRAVIVGERTFGKGSVQNITPLVDGSALKLTIALYYTPSGVSIQAEGVVPDIEVPFEAVKEEDEKTPKILLREQNLNRHLENKNGKKDKDKDAAKTKDAKDSAMAADEKAVSQLAKDNQLRMAFQILRGLPNLQAIKN